MDDGQARSLQAEDGYVLHYRVWEPEGAPSATLVLFNGVMSHSGWFFPLAPLFVRAGFRVVGADRRGTGACIEQRGDAPSAQVVVDDAIAIVDRHRIEGRPLYILAWCWGSVLAANVVQRMVVDGLVLVTPGLFPSDVVKENSVEADRAGEGRPEDEPCLAAPIHDEMFTDGPHLDGFIRQDPNRLRLITPRFRKIMTKLAVMGMARLKKIDAPILVLLARGDVATNNEAARTTLAKLPTPTQIVEITAGHGMQFDAPEEVAAAVLEWTSRVDTP